MGAKTSFRIELTREERKELEGRARSFRLPYRTVVRAQIILSLASGKGPSAVAREVRRSRQVVWTWGRRFNKKRLDGLEDDPRSGRPPIFSPGGRDVSGEAGVRAA